MSIARTLVFVYGTLKRGGSNHAFLESQEFVGDARTPPGFRLFEIADYPGLVKDPSDRRGVYGEVWSVDAHCLADLAALEGIEEKLYRRAPLPLLPPFDQSPVEGYFYLRNIRGRRPLIDGNWPVRIEPPRTPF
ncbi:MAG: gamma-glutamylcyclotransferase [Candidatus Synoicihabitans palmerolidicus]|nr:gamma-glutamylcyclotransferase [Candidatus Synoicihabitans palmerolidicus]